MKNILKKARIDNGFKTREVAHTLKIDQALISKFESGSRKPTKEQLTKLAQLYKLDFETLMITWHKEKLLSEIGTDIYAIKAILLVQEQLQKNYLSAKKLISNNLQLILNEIDDLQNKLTTVKPDACEHLTQEIEIAYTFESNRIGGNKLTLEETDLVINKGVTIYGKSMRDHLEAINHQEAIDYIKKIKERKSALTEKEIIYIHTIISRGINSKSAGNYRNNELNTQENTFACAPGDAITKEMDALFLWYESNKKQLHPIVLATEMHEKLLVIDPFSEGNRKIALLIMNLILLQHNFVIANLKVEAKTKTAFDVILETNESKKNTEIFTINIATIEKQNLERYLEL